MAANRKLWIAALVCAAATTVGVTGCGKGDDTGAKGGGTTSPSAAPTKEAPKDPFAGMDADAIADKATEATKKATSLHMIGGGKNDGADMKVDFAVDERGACTGKMTQQGATAEMLKAEGQLYMKGNEKFWRTTAGGKGGSAEETNAMVELLKGRWMKVSGKDKDMGEVCDLDSLRKDMEKDKSDTKGATRGPDSEVNGQPAAVLTNKKSGGESVTMYVAKEGEPYILRVVETGGDEPGTVTLTDYNKPVNATKPPADQVIDLEKLGGRS
ncbi:hypothetical protein ACIGO8_02510 [Streptomyces sp. NPDC053493]|uniref:hypothetical protein n=1 Tax=Streptomyces sp. NPDC053493 TaxID=3365705 RepID=UPI0037D53021